MAFHVGRIQFRSSRQAPNKTAWLRVPQRVKAKHLSSRLAGIMADQGNPQHGGLPGKPPCSTGDTAAARGQAPKLNGIAEPDGHKHQQESTDSHSGHM
ncbi:hypothetical protein [Nitratidesulfovibrio sp. SRB-5]|uniref:hypothetical protein n=1 Tax=Nitratidesulfovibrio sp. SRB-5 TaxID=2872636 RepID=UPI001027A6BD|nr:hypothetical protein [Nitratidesulfovibrio sp. SRB-5]MBZ2173334.1 hypothetical protein [Nitratidesulfovibrio sp. SRB-5]RXF76729.1 hypothetical protein EKK70_10255 [Desulfovibrio sp. DS-1]